MEALRHSPALVTDPDEADVILVDDYCYKLRWLAYVHADGHPNLSSEADEAASAETVVGVRGRSRLARPKGMAAAVFGLRGRLSSIGPDLKERAPWTCWLWCTTGCISLGQKPVRQSSRAGAAAHGMCSCRVPQAHSAAGERRKPAAA